MDAEDRRRSSGDWGERRVGGYMTCFKNAPQMEHPERPSREKGRGGNTPLCGQ